MTQQQMGTGPPSGGTPQSDIVNSDSNDQAGPGGAPAVTLPSVVPEAMRQTPPTDFQPMAPAAAAPAPMTKRSMFSNMSNKVMDDWASLEASRASETDSADSVVIAQDRLAEVMAVHGSHAVLVDIRQENLANSVKSMANFMEDWYDSLMLGHRTPVSSEEDGNTEETPG